MLHWFVLVFALLAPPLDVTVRGKQCRIKTDVKPRLAKEVAAQIDRYCANFAGFWEGLGLETRSNNKVVIRLFAEHEDFVEFYHRNSPGKNPPAAYFSPSLNGVVSYYAPDDPYIRQVLFHETSHQYMYRYMDWAPKWANEGMAEYFEGWRLTEDGELIEKRPPFYDLLVLRKALGKTQDDEDTTTSKAPSQRYLPPQELVEMKRETFNEFRTKYPDLNGYLHYSTAWGLTWYFLEGPHEADRALYLAYLARLCDKGERAEPLVMEDWDAFEERWKTFILGIELEPASVDDHVILAANLRQEREYAEAIGHYQSALELAPETPDLHYWIGYCYKRRGNYDKATPHLETAAEQDQTDPAPLYQLARIVARLDREEETGDPERGLEYARQASQRVKDKHPFYLSFVARCQNLNGDTKAAKKTMKKVLKLVKKADETVQARYQKMLDEME